ncbi:uncharacterized protein LOC143856351 [Tasmannia lanceolata]|uniref:uncharacterized protein LOC143856351 n=1 Tax=Tasmannia lanceolata TaxID=3420 RepID=UPI004063237B
MGVEVDKNTTNLKKGAYTFKIQGQLHHYVPSLMPTDNCPKFLQLYFYDTEHESNNRLHHIPDLRREIIDRIISILEISPYSQFLKSLRHHKSLQDCAIIINKDCGLDQRVYNAPTASQVAAIWIEGVNNESLHTRDIILRSHCGHTCRIQSYFGCYDPLQYPLLFPRGETGWHKGIRRSAQLNTSSRTSIAPCDNFTEFETLLCHENATTSRRENTKDISCREYYANMFQMRDNNRWSIIHSGRLFQQYVVDMCVKVETGRLNFFYEHQSTIRADLYQGIVDSVVARKTHGCKIGKRIVVPASFIGGPLDMCRRYLDSLALVQHYGKPDLFLTITCNPEWEEIMLQLKPEEKAYNRPDLTTRVFKGKFEDLKKQLFEKHALGCVVAHADVIEFQKRGLPHAHLLLVLEKGSKMLSPDEYDNIVCAELPDENSEPILFERVVKQMMHGPCGNLRTSSPCMIDGQCKFHYPRAFCETTKQEKDDYATYHRRCNGRQVYIRNQYLDNKWVVPYNPYLLKRYNCHINVEICSSIKAVKYLYKYIYKGHDKVAMQIVENEAEAVVDEIHSFQNARWVSPPEAIWRIYAFDLYKIHPSVINLQLHLPNEQLITYWQNQKLSELLKQEHLTRTMLTEYFNMNIVVVDAKKYLYHEFSEHYVWMKEVASGLKERSKKSLAK